MNLLESALRYSGKAGWHVHPVRPDKKPLLQDWPNNATTDSDKINEFWTKYPNALIGVLCGPKSKIWVLDVDQPDGLKSLELLEQKHGKLPDTLVQKSGSGGLHYFWKWTDKNIRNSAGKIGKNLDVRGEGGSIIVSPSATKSGNQYKWINRNNIVEAPNWLTELAIKPAQSMTIEKTYGQTALSNELSKLAQSTVGGRNDCLNSSAYSLGQLVAGGELDPGAVEGALVGVAISIGLHEQEARATVKSGMEAGALEPRAAPNTSDFGKLSESDIDSVISCNQMKSNESGCNQSVINLKSSCNQSEITQGRSLAERIRDWICNSPGSFTNLDIDREFCLSTRQEKVNRAVILNRLYINKDIKKDKRKKDLWYVIDKNIEWVDLDADDPEAFPIHLPFGLHEYVLIPPHAIIILAGSSNAGKTAWILNTLRLNLAREYNRLYLMSEMGSSEYRTRIKNFGDGLEPWKRVKAAPKSYDFDGAIETYNPDGLTCIDFLEEVEGEYHKIPTDIRHVYDSLKNGVAIIAIQKRSDQEYARGGQGTVEKARLVMNLDYLATGDRCIICALKLVKVKHFLQRNLQNHEIHFKLSNGCQIEPISDWMLSNSVNRKRMAAQYEAGDYNTESGFIYFKTVEGDDVRVTMDQVNKWQESYPYIDVEEELERIANDSLKKPFLKKKGWFFAMPGLLRKADIKKQSEH